MSLRKPRYSLRTSRESPEDHENVVALAEFLMQTPPPQGNRMSPSSEILSRKNSFKIFGGHKKRKTNTPKLIQLPDNAICSTTRSGARHIAISIPVPNDCEKETTFTSHPSQRIISEAGTVTVLKPVVEVHESKPSGGASARLRDSTQMAPDISKLDDDAHEQYGTALRSYKSYVAVPPKDGWSDIARAESLHSRASTYSMVSSVASSLPCQGLGYAPARGPTPDLFPCRISSKSRIPNSLDEELREISYSEDKSSIRGIRTPPRPTSSSGSRCTSPSGAHCVTARVTGSSSGPKIEKAHVVASSTSPGPAPTTSLPDLPPTYRPSSKMSGRHSTISGRSSITDVQDRVGESGPSAKPGIRRARKPKDIVWMGQSHIRVRDSVCNSPASPFTIGPSIGRNSQHSPSIYNQSARNSQYSPSIYKQASELDRSISLSRIMTVADVTPSPIATLDTGSTTPSRWKTDPPIATTRRHSADPLSSSFNCDHEDTDSRSPLDHLRHWSLPIIKTMTPDAPAPHSTMTSWLEILRKERRSRRNVAVKERALEERVCELERTNAVLLGALNSIVKRLGELNGPLYSVQNTFSLKDMLDDVAWDGYSRPESPVVECS